MRRYTHEVYASGEREAKLAQRPRMVPRMSGGSPDVWEISTGSVEVVSV